MIQGLSMAMVGVLLWEYIVIFVLAKLLLDWHLHREAQVDPLTLHEYCSIVLCVMPYVHTNLCVKKSLWTSSFFHGFLLSCFLNTAKLKALDFAVTSYCSRSFMGNWQNNRSIE